MRIVLAVAAEFRDQRDHPPGRCGSPAGPPSFPLSSRQSKPLAPPGTSAFSAPRSSRSNSRPERSDFLSVSDGPCAFG